MTSSAIGDNPGCGNAFCNTRREFLKNVAFTGGAAALAGCSCPFRGGKDGRVPYGDTIGDRLWMWGHHSMSFAAQLEKKCNYNLPLDRRIDMAAACREMNIPGCFVVRWFNLPEKAELPEYMKQFKDTKRVGFSITDSAVETFEEKVRLGLEYAGLMPNLTTLIMDDFWCGANNSKLEQIYRAKEEIVKRNLRLSIVLYSDQNGLKSEYSEVLNLCDEVTFWFWHGKNVNTIESQVAKLKDLVGHEKPILLGQYMYDFGGKKEMPGKSMEIQLEHTSRLLSQKAIDGVIFHCTPLVDMNLDAVRVSRAWIRENATRKWGA